MVHLSKSGVRRAANLVFCRRQCERYFGVKYSRTGWGGRGEASSRGRSNKAKSNPSLATVQLVQGLLFIYL